MAIDSLGACNIEYCDETNDDKYEYINEDEITEEDLQSGLYERCECVEIEEEVEVDDEDEEEEQGRNEDEDKIEEVNQLG